MWGAAQLEDPLGIWYAGSRGLIRKVSWKLRHGLWPSLVKGLLSELYSGLGHKGFRPWLLTLNSPRAAVQFPPFITPPTVIPDLLGEGCLSSCPGHRLGSVSGTWAEVKGKVLYIKSGLWALTG